MKLRSAIFIVVWFGFSLLAFGQGGGNPLRKGASAGVVKPSPDPFEYEIPKGMTTPNYLRFDQPSQQGPYCGPNSLYVLLRLHQLDVNYGRLLKQCQVSENGCSLEELQKVAHDYGLECEVRKLSLLELEKIRPPYLLHLSSPANSSKENPDAQGHFTVILERSGEDYRGVDAAKGTAHYWSRRFLARNFSGYVLLPKGVVGPSWFTTRRGILLVLSFVSLSIANSCLLFQLLKRSLMKESSAQL